MSETDGATTAEGDSGDSDSGASDSGGGQGVNDVVTKLSARSVAETASLFTQLLIGKGMKIFTVIDQSAEARLAGLQLRETIVIVFGNPVGGTPVMDAAPLSGLDLPLKVMVWSDQGQTKVSYVSPDALGTRYRLSADLVANLRGIDALTDALVAG